VAEELALDQIGRKGRAVDNHKGPVRPRAFGVDGAGDELLADPGLAEDQHRGVARRDLPHLVEDVEQGVRAADDVLEAVLGKDLLAQVDILLLETIPEDLELGDRAFELSGGALDFLLGFPALGDVRAHAEQPLHLAAGIPQHDAAPSHDSLLTSTGDQKPLIFLLGFAQQPEVDRGLHFVALVFRHELKVRSPNHLRSRVAGDLLGERVDRGDSPLPVHTHHQELDAVKQLPPPPLVGDHLARQLRGANEILRQIPAHGGHDHKKCKGVGTRYVEPTHIGRDDGDKPEGVDHQAAAKEPRLPTPAATDHADGAVDED